MKDKHHTDIKENNSPASPPESAPVYSPKSAHSHEFKSVGYTAHNELTYRGVDWLLNSTVGVGFTYWGARTKMGQEWYSKPLLNKFESITKKIFSNEKLAMDSANGGLMITSIMVGGLAIIPVMMGLENKENKKAIIHAIDQRYYGTEYMAKHPEFKWQDNAIDHEPEKDFTTGIISRYAALTPLILMCWVPPIHKPMERMVYEPIGNVTKTAAEALKIKPQKMMTEGVHQIIDDKKVFDSNWNFLHRTIGFDFGLTAIYSAMHEMAYKALALRKQKKSGHFHEHDQPGEAHQSLVQQDLKPVPVISEETGPTKWQNRVKSTSTSPQKALTKDGYESYIMNQQHDTPEDRVIH